MGLCAYNGGLNGFRKQVAVVTVNLWKIESSKLLKLVHKIEQNQPLNSHDFNILRHEATNYDSLLNNITVTPEKRQFFQAVANEAAEQELKRLVLNQSGQNLLSQYLKTAQERKEILGRIQEIETQCQDRGQRIASLNTKLGQQKKELAKRYEELSKLEEALKTQTLHIQEQQLLLLHQKQENKQLEGRLQHQKQENEQLLQRGEKAALALTRQLAFAKQRLWVGVCASTICSLVLGVAVTTAMDSPSNTRVTSELTTNR